MLEKSIPYKGVALTYHKPSMLYLNLATLKGSINVGMYASSTETSSLDEKSLPIDLSAYKDTILGWVKTAMLADAAFVGAKVVAAQVEP